MSAQRRQVAVLALTLTAGLLSGCSSAPPRPQTTAGAYLAAWASQDGAGMRQLASHPPADFTPVNQAAFSNLSVRQASFSAGAMQTNASAASTPITERLTLAGLGTITIRSALHLVLQQAKWRGQSIPAPIAPPPR